MDSVKETAPHGVPDQNKAQHPLMATTRRREKEVVAVAFNQKEQRVLEKSLATIRLEASYSLKLLDLHNRTVKVHFRQLKDKVSRIKSHLEPEEINKLRQLEAEGKLQPMYTPVSLGSALKIAAAARRLNSSHGRGPGGKPRAKSALPRVNLPDHGSKSNGSLAPPPGTLVRSNSVTGVFIDVPPSAGGYRPSSASLTVGRLSPTAALDGQRVRNGNAVMSVDNRTMESKQNGPRLQIGNDAAGKPGSKSSRTTPKLQNGNSESSMDSQHTRGSGHPPKNKPMDSSQFKKPGTSSAMMNGHAHSDLAKSRKTSASTSHSKATTSHSHAPFSSHVATEKEAREREAGGKEVTMTTPRSIYGSMDRNSSFLGLQDDTVDDLGEDLFAERRAELLEEEQYRAATIIKRKDRFLRDIDQYLKDHPPLSATLPTPISVKSKSQDERGIKGKETGVDGLSSSLFRRRRVEFNTSPTYLPEEDYRERLMGLWRDMNKCRYLRVPDDMIDLSGINTLATDTMRLFQVLRKQETEPVPNAWVE